MGFQKLVQIKPKAFLLSYLVGILYMAGGKVTGRPTSDGLADKELLRGENDGENDEKCDCGVTVETVTEWFWGGRKWVAHIPNQIQEPIHWL